MQSAHNRPHWTRHSSHGRSVWRNAQFQLTALALQSATEPTRTAASTPLLALAPHSIYSYEVVTWSVVGSRRTGATPQKLCKYSHIRRWCARAGTGNGSTVLLHTHGCRICPPNGCVRDTSLAPPSAMLHLRCKHQNSQPSSVKPTLTEEYSHCTWTARMYKLPAAGEPLARAT